MAIALQKVVKVTWNIIMYSEKLKIYSRSMLSVKMLLRGDTLLEVFNQGTNVIIAMFQ